MLPSINHYLELIQEIRKLPEAEKKAISRKLCRTDLYFLLIYGLKCDYMLDVEKPGWLLDRCAEVQANPNGYIDLWSRDHFKSTIITFGKTIQDILASHGDNPLPEWNGIEVTTGIFSFNRPTAKKFLSQIMTEFENNDLLKSLFDDVLFDDPKREAPKWSEDGGLIVKRKSNPKEATVEAWGLIDGQPTSKHFQLCVYDDVISIDHVGSRDMIHKTNKAWELSINLGTEGGRRRYIGTRYVTQDTYQLIMDRKAATPRIYPGTADGTEKGPPVLRTKEEMLMKLTSMGTYTFAAQILQNPVSDKLQEFKTDWIHHYDNTSKDFTCRGMNVYILYDPANKKKENDNDDPDYTAMMVVGLAPDNNYYLLDILRDRLNPTERIKRLIQMHKKWNTKSGKPPKVVCEQYGMMTDAFYLTEKQKQLNYRFSVVTVGGKMKKEDRIKRLVPIFQQGRLYLPKIIFYATLEGERVELVQKFIDEELAIFPRKGFNSHDDMLDALSRIMDEEVKAVFPKVDKLDFSDDYGNDRPYQSGDFMDW